MVYLIVRAVSIVFWIVITIAIGGFYFTTDFGRDWRFLCLLITSPLIGFLISYPHPYESFKLSIRPSLIWGLVQLYAGVVLFGISAGVGVWLNHLGLSWSILGKLGNIVETVVWFAGLLTFNPLVLFHLWMFVVLTQLLLCWVSCKKRGQRSDPIP